MDEAIVAFTQDRVMRLTGLSRRQINYWADTGLLEPSVEERLTPHRPVRLYSYRDAMSLLVIAELRRQRSLQAVRAVVAHVRSRNFEPNEVRFAVSGRDVFIQLPDGTWEDGFVPGRMPMVTIDLRPLRHRAAKATERDPDSVGKIERRRGALGSKPLIAGTRVPVEAVHRYLARGATAAEIMQAYPSLQPEDVEAARTYAA